MQCRPVGVHAADDPQRDQPVRRGPQLQHVLPGLPVAGGSEQAGQDVADGLPLVPGVSGLNPDPAQAVHQLIQLGFGQGEVEVGVTGSPHGCLCRAGCRALGQGDGVRPRGGHLLAEPRESVADQGEQDVVATAEVAVGEVR
jgi:hypothetical protein